MTWYAWWPSGGSEDAKVVPGAYRGRSVHARECNMKIALIACACLSVSRIAAAQAPPLEVQGVALGASAEQLQQTIPQFRCYGATCSFDPSDAATAQCGPVSSDPSVLACYAQAGSQYAFASAHGARYAAYLHEGRVGEFRVTFPMASADTVASTLQEKYGPPSLDREFDAKNRLGASFVNRVVTWRRADGEITVERRALDVDTGLATFIAAWYAQATAGNKAIAEKSDATPGSP